MFKYCLYKFSQFLVNHLPLSFSYKIVEMICDIQYAVSRVDREAVRNNLKHILAKDDQSRLEYLTRDVFRNFGRYLLEFFRMEKYLDQEFINSQVDINNPDIIANALKEGRGVIILAAHIGNWELGGAILSMLGFPITAVALPHKERPVNELFNRQRENKGIKVVPTSIAIRKCLEALRNNECVALLGDRDFNSKSGGVVMDFLNSKATVPLGAAIFSIKTGAPIIPAFLIRQPGNRFTLSLHEPIRSEADSRQRSESSIRKLMEKYVKVIEKEIFQNPSQWLMFREFSVS